MIKRLVFALIFGIVAFSAYAAPVIWESDLGSELTQLTGEDDKEQLIPLDFNFPYFGVYYREISVNTNGVITIQADSETPYSPNVTRDFTNATGFRIAPFWSDLSLSSSGTVFLNQFDDRVVITWSRVGSFASPPSSFTFQAQLMADGRIIFGYNGISNIVSGLDGDLVVGLSRGASDADMKDYTDSDPIIGNSVYEFMAGGSTYEAFGTGKPFDLDNNNLIFVTNLGFSGIVVNIPDPNLAAALRNVLGLLPGQSITDTALASLTSLDISNKGIMDLTGLEFCENVEILDLSIGQISDLSALEELGNLLELYLYNNQVSDMQPLVDNAQLDTGDMVNVRMNALSYEAITVSIPALQARGVIVIFDDRTPTTISIVSGDGQIGMPGSPLPEAFVVEVRDQNGYLFAGVPVTFTVTLGGGSVDVTGTTADADGLAWTTLTLGAVAGDNAVDAAAAGIIAPVTFTAVGLLGTMFSWTPEPQDEGSAIQFTDESISAIGWSWDFDSDDGIQVDSTDQNPSFTFNANGIYTVTLTATYDGSLTESISLAVTVDDLSPTAAFDWSPKPQDEGSPVSFTDASASSPDTIVGWSWDFDGLGDSTDQDPTFTFDDDGVHTVTLIVTDDDGSTDTISRDVTVADLDPTAAFDWSPKPQDEGVSVQFTDSSTSSPDTITGWSWDFDGLSSSNDQNPSFIFIDDGIYTVTLTVTDDDGSIDIIPHDVTVDPVNDAPVADDDSATTDEDTSVTVDVLADDTDADGDTLTVDSVTQGTNGSVTNNGTDVTYTPNANYNGEDSFDYTVSDGNGGTDTATVTMTITGVNDGPVAVDDVATTDEDTPLSVVAPGVLGNDSDVDGDALTAVIDAGVSHGTLTLNADGSFSYTPDADFNGSDSFSYTVSDGNGGSDIATVTITVTPVNDAPVAANDAYGTDEDTTVDIAAVGVLGNDSDVDGDTLTAVIDTGVSHGTLTLNADGSFSYTPVPDFNGIDSFIYTASDGNGGTDTATVTMTITGVNDGPVAVDDVATTDEDTPLSVVAPGVLGNDSDVDGDALTAVIDAGVSHGTLTLNTDGSFSYTPAGNFNGTDSFTYHATDGSDDSNVATVTITVNPVNDAPVANADSDSTNEDSSVDVAVLGNDSDVDGSDVLSVASVDDTSTTGSASLLAGIVTYDPNGQFEYLAVGQTATDSFSYTADDGNGGISIATVTMTITGVNDGPVANADSDTTDEDSSAIVAVLANDTDVDASDVLTVASVDDTSTTGDVSFTAVSIIYDPNGQFEHLAVGETATDSFGYTASDGNGGTDTATVTMTITGVNDGPVAVDDVATTDEDTPLSVVAPGVLGNDSDVDGDALTAVIDAGVSHGTLTLNANGSFSYTPTLNFNGTDSFDYTVSDGNGGTDTATVTITVNPVNDPPVAGNDSATTSEDTPVTVNVLADDTDIDGDLLSVFSVTQGTNGSVVNNGSDVTYTPNADYNGPDSFDYTISDGNGGTATATVTITVNPMNDPPVAKDDTYRTGQNVELVIAAPGVLDNDIDLDGDKLFVADYEATGTSGGTIVMESDGSFTYTPGDLFAGMDTFTYEACDPGADAGNDDDLCDTATVSITVEAKNQRSIRVEAYEFLPEDIETPNGVFETLTGSFLITNTSNLQPSEVQISSMEIGVEVRYGSKGKYTPIDPTLISFSFDPEPSFLFTTTQLVNYVCILPDSLDEGGFEVGDTVRVTTHVSIFEGHKPFKSSFSKLIEAVAAAPASVLPTRNALRRNYPNPFNPETWIPFELGADADVRVEIYSVVGHLIRTLELGYRAAGYHVDRSRAAHWDGRNKYGESVASGVYFYKLTAGDFSAMHRMIVLK